MAESLRSAANRRYAGPPPLGGKNDISRRDDLQRQGARPFTRVVRLCRPTSLENYQAEFTVDSKQYMGQPRAVRNSDDRIPRLRWTHRAHYRQAVILTKVREAER